MTEQMPVVDELGPLDYVVVEFPSDGRAFVGEMVAELTRLHDVGLIRVLDLLVIVKDESGGVTGHEPSDVIATARLRQLQDRASEIFSTADVDLLAAALRPGTVAGVVVWENAWAVPFLTAAQRADGQVVATGNIPLPALLASIEAELAAELSPLDTRTGTGAALRTGRAGGRGVLGAPVRRTAIEVGAAAVVVDSVDRRQAARRSRPDPEDEDGAAR